MSGPDPDASGGSAPPRPDPTRLTAAAAPPDGSAGAAAAPVAPLAPDASVDTASPLAGVDLDRRRFFRQLATDVFHTAATVVGAATALQRGTAEAASAILNGPAARAEEEAAVAGNGIVPSPAGTGAVTLGAGTPRAGAAAAGTESSVAAAGSASTFGRPRAAVGYHSAFRVEGDRIVLLDQRRLPFELVEVHCRTAIEVANAIAARAIVGGPAVAQAAALGLAASANRLRSSQPYARRAILRAAEATLRSARPTSRPLRAVVERVIARYEAIGEFDEDGDRIADAVQDEADAIVFEANDDHGRLADAAATRIPRRADRPAGVLTLGATGAMAGGQFGTAMGAVQAAIYADRHVHVYVLEGRPRLDGARVAVWELAQAGIPHTLVTDAAAGWLLQGGTIDVVLVGAEAIALNGDVANDVGSYPVAALAVRHNVPLIVCAPLAAVDPAAPDGNALVNDERPRWEVVELAKSPLTLADTAVMNPAVDVTPAGLVTAFATEEGLIEGSFGRELQAALERRAARHPSFAAGSPPIAEAGATGPAGSGT